MGQEAEGLAQGDAINAYREAKLDRGKSNGKLVTWTAWFNRLTFRASRFTFALFSCRYFARPFAARDVRFCSRNRNEKNIVWKCVRALSIWNRDVKPSSQGDPRKLANKHNDLIKGSWSLRKIEFELT